MSGRNPHYSFLLFVIFKIRVVIPKFRFSKGFGTGNFSLCETDFFADGKSGYFTVCLDLDVITFMCVLNKITIV
jgi:hypothetical protein